MMKGIAALVIALALAAAGGTAARADPISASILTTIGIQATATAVAVTTFALTTAASIAIGYLQQALNKKAPAAESAIGGSSGKLAGGGTVPRTLGVGTFMTAGSLTYVNTYGDLGKTPNAVFVQEMALADIPVAGLVEVWVNGAKVTYNPAAPPGNFGTTIPEFTVGGIAHLWIRFTDGTQTTADPMMVSLFGAHPERPYSTRRIGFGVAKAVIFALVNPELFSGFPQVKFVLQGAKLYDRRFDDTAGGAGDQRRDDPATWAFTENPAVIRENIVRGIRWNGAWQYGGQTVGEAQLPAPSWFAAANECDAPTALAGGGTEPQFRAGGEITFDTPPADVLDALNKADNGRLAEIGGIYKTRSGAAGAAVFAFTDRDILTSREQTFDPFAAQSGQINHVTARYPSPEEGWNFKDAPALVDLGLEAIDGRRLSTSANYGFVTSGTQVQRLMRAERDTARAWRRHALPMPPDAFVLEPLDVVVWTSTRNGYAAKSFEIVSAEDLPNLNMGLALKELDPSAYDWEAEVHERPTIDGTITVLRPPPQPIIAWFADPYTLTAGGRSRPAIQLGWDPAVSDVDGIRFEVRLKDTQELVLTGEEGRPVFERGSLVVSQNLLPVTLYQARGQYRPASPRMVQWSSWLDVLTPDTRIVQAELSADLDARVRQIEEQLPALQQRLRTDLGKITASLGDMRAGVHQEAGLIRMGAGAQFGRNKAAVQAALVAMVDGDQALAASILALTATVSGNTAAINAEQLVRSAADEAFAGSILELETDVADNAVDIADEALARSTADSALGTRITTLFATGPGGSAEARLRFITSVTPAGAVASIAMEINVAAAGAPNWQPAGIYLDGMAGFSRIRQRASQLVYEDVGLNGGAPFAVFTIGGGEAVLNALLRVATANIKDAAITNAKIGSAAVQSANIADLNVRTLHIAGANVTSTNSTELGVNVLQVSPLSTAIYGCTTSFIGVAGSVAQVVVTGIVQVKNDELTAANEAILTLVLATDAGNKVIAADRVPGNSQKYYAFARTFNVTCTGGAQNFTATVVATCQSSFFYTITAGSSVSPTALLR